MRRHVDTFARLYRDSVSLGRGMEHISITFNPHCRAWEAMRDGTARRAILYRGTLQEARVVAIEAARRESLPAFEFDRSGHACKRIQPPSVRA